MALVRFTGDVYDFIEDGSIIRFTEDKQHNRLFNYVFNKKLSLLPELLEQYILKKMNITTFELNDYKYTDEDREEIINLLESIHDYYSSEGKRAFVDMIGDYFNAILFKTTYRKDEHPSLHPTYEKDWYMQRFQALAGRLLLSNDKAPDKFHAHYRMHVGDKLEPGEEGFQEIPSYIINSPISECINEIRTQEKTARILYWILDITAVGLKDLTTAQRIWLYANIFGTAIGNSGDIAVVKHLSLIAPARDVAGEENSRRWKFYNKRKGLFGPIRDRLNDYHKSPDDISPEKLKVLTEAIEQAKLFSETGVCEEYEISDLYHLLFLEVLKMAEAGVQIRKCRHCGRYFVVTNLNMKYCFQVADGEESPCNIIGSKSAFDDKVESDLALKLYNRSYKTHYSRINGDTFTKDHFQKWKKEAKTKLGEVRNNQLDISKFEEWLKK